MRTLLTASQGPEVTALLLAPVPSEAPSSKPRDECERHSISSAPAASGESSPVRQGGRRTRVDRC